MNIAQHLMFGVIPMKYRMGEIFGLVRAKVPREGDIHQLTTFGTARHSEILPPANMVQ